MEIKCDVLVVGAGASGSVAALTSAKKKLDTIVIEKDKRVGESIGDRIDITENIGLYEIMRKLKLHVKDRTNRMLWFSPDYSLSIKSKIYDLFFRRGPSPDSFEGTNIQNARDKGAELILNTKIMKLDVENNFVKSVIIKSGHKKITIRPKIVIGCDGNDSVILRKFATELKLKKHSKLLAYGLMGNNLDIEPLVTHVFFDALKVPGGYFYLVRFTDNQGIACIVLEKSRTNEVPEYYFKNFLDSNKFLKKSFINFTPDKIFRGFGHIDSLKSRGVGNVLLAGDAGRLIDPFFGYGMRNSIISGYLAADVASYAIRKANLKFLGKYDARLSLDIPTLTENCDMRDAYTQLRNDDFNRIFSGLITGKELDETEFPHGVHPILEVFSSTLN
ncbi:MAG: NAD(P)/FAD-dependent oxidoreductase [Candidatus Altiarchaeota archaeon]|nr:NAD(P)/FAD-dependent oxidoreductase [Candidatus Altiarchaeota archaeon]